MPVEVTSGNRVFADAVRFRWTLNPMTGVSIRDKRDIWSTGKEDVKTEAEAVLT